MTIEENKALCERFPFLVSRNIWTGEIISGYTFTKLDMMPNGWRKAFGIQFCEELKAALEEEGGLDDWQIIEIKEKYGELRVYANWYIPRVDAIITKYEDMSRRTCIECGKPATKVLIGWISPYCDECATKISNENFLSIDKFYKNLDLS